MTATLPEPAPLPRAPATPVATSAHRGAALRSGHFLVANSALTAVSGLVYWLVAARAYDADDVGRSLAVISAVTLLGGVAQANVMTALLRFVPYSGAASRRVVLRGYLLAGVLTALAAAVFVAGLGRWSDELRFLRDDPLLAGWFVVSVTVWAWFSIQDHVLTAVRRAAVVPVENAAFAVLKLVLVIGLAVAAPATGIFLSWTISAAVVVAVTSAYVLFRAVPAHMVERPVEQVPALRTMGRFLALDYVASLFLFAAVSGLPLVVIARVGAVDTAGLLLAWTISYSLYLVPLAMGQSLVAHSADPGADLDRDVRSLIAHTMMLVAPAAFLVVVFAPQILALFGPDYVVHDTTLRLLALSAVPNVLIDLRVSAAQVLQRMRVVVGTRMAQSVLVIGLALYLMDSQGVRGVAAAWLIGQTVVAVVLARLGGGPTPVVGRPAAPPPPVVAAPPVTVSVVICCWTDARWEQLVAAAESLRAQTTEPLEVIVVVDHNPELLDRVRAALPWARTVASTGQPGLSGARNTGVALAAGDVVAFLDDDAAAGPEWVAAQAAAYADSTVVGTAARIEPVWAAARPGWFPPEFDWVVGCSWTGGPEGPAEVRNAVGAGMSLRRVPVLLLGGFDEGLGRVGTVPVGCEETELCIRLRQAHPGVRIVSVPAAVTHHHVPAERGTFRYFRSRCWAEGISKAGVAERTGADSLGTERSYATRVIPLAVARALRDRRPRRALALLAGVAITAAGYLSARLLPQSAARAQAGRVLRLAAATLPLAAGVATWLFSLRGVDPAAMTDLGLVSVLPPAWFLALGGIVVLIALHIARGSAGAVIGAHLVGALLVLHATPALLYDEPRYSWTFKHLGVVDYINRHGGIDPSDPTLGVYHSWPGFFTFSALLSDMTGMDPATLARWAPVFFPLAFGVPALVAFRALTDDVRRVWLGVSLLALTNWVGQDYFAPQAMTFFLFLCVVALVLRWGPGTPRATTILLAALMLAVTGSHQLTPPVLLGVLLVQAIRPGSAPRWLPLPMALFTAVWMATLGREYLAAHSPGLLATLGRPDNNAAETLASATSTEQAVVIWAGRALVLLVAALAALTLLRERRDVRTLTAALLALVPVPLVVSSYDGEIVFRVYLFALPWAALLAAGAVARRRRRLVPTTALLLTLTALFTLAYYGKERANYFDAEERAANVWVREHAEPGSVLVGAALDFPWKDRDYERFRYAWLSELPVEKRRELATDPTSVVIDLMGESEAFTGYLLLSDAQDAALDYGTDLPHEIQDTIAGALLASGDFQLVYASPGALVLRHEFVVATDQQWWGATP